MSSNTDCFTASVNPDKDHADSAKDPVCGMSVVLNGTKPSLEFEEETYHFCSSGCHDKFQADPEFYLTGGHLKRRQNSAGKNTQYTCPMHPEIIKDEFTDCPLCGMALEPIGAPADGPNPEMVDFTRRFAFSAVFTIPVLVLAMGPMLGIPVRDILGSQVSTWAEMLFTAPIVIWAAAPFFKRGWSSLQNRSPNMWTLIAIGVGAAFLYSVVATLLPDLFPLEIRKDGTTVPVYFESAAVIICLVFLGQILELRAREQTGDAIKSLMKLAPQTACRINEKDQERDVPIENILPGDRLRIKPGDSIPVDGVILEGNSSLNESMLTGEALPTPKSPGEAVIAGTLNTSGSLIIQAEKTGDETALSGIIEMVVSAQRSRAPIQNLADRVAAYFVPTVVLTAIATFVIWMLIGPEPAFSFALVSAVSVLIIACPCALGLATPMSIMAATGRGALGGVLIRNAEGLEGLSRATVLVVDKTGTLTEGKPSVTNIAPVDGRSRKDLLALAAGLEKGSEHPLANAILTCAEGENILPLPVTGFHALSGMGTHATLPDGPVAIGNRAFMAHQKIDISALEGRALLAEKRGETIAYVARKGALDGMITLSDTLKKEARGSLAVLKKQGLRIIIATGDSEGPAKVVGEKLGLDEIYYNLLPADKKQLVEKLQNEGHIVAMAGDGINDAPALVQSNVGIAMGTGMDVSLESADITLLNGDLRATARAVKLSHETIRNIKQNLVLAFGYNSICVPIAAGILYPLTGSLLSPMIAAAAMSLSSVSVITNALRLRNLKLDEGEA
ncbi:MAG: heavy metal translocating P-type ATPase [Sneathiella sp.]